MTLRIVQNCFRVEQLAECTFEPYLNAVPLEPDERYLFFESSVISTLVLNDWHAECDHFGVLGYRWRAKLHEAKSWTLPLRNLSRGTLTPDSLIRFVIDNPDADFLSLGRFMPHPVFRVAENCHRGFMEATGRLLDSLGVRFDLRHTVANPIYFNAFIGTRSAIDAYVKDLLAPAIHAATHDPELRRLCLRDAGYFRPFPGTLGRLYGINHYPLHPFIGERLINVHTVLSGSRVVSFDGGGPDGLVSRTATSLRRCIAAIRGRLRALRRSPR